MTPAFHISLPMAEPGMLRPANRGGSSSQMSISFALVARCAMKAATSESVGGIAATSKDSGPATVGSPWFAVVTGQFPFV